MFIPNTTATVSRFLRNNGYGEPTYDEATPVACAIVRMISKAEKTSVRADSSATRGNADENTADARMLFPKTFKPGKGDKVVIHGQALKVVWVHTRAAVTGPIDHFEVDLMHWA